MNELEKIISRMNFQYFGTGQHKINSEAFLEKEKAVLLDVRAKEEVETVKLGLIDKLVAQMLYNPLYL